MNPINEPSRKKRKIKYDPEEAARLERAVFGTANDIVQNVLDDTRIRTVKHEISAGEIKNEDSDSNSSNLNFPGDNSDSDTTEDDYDSDISDSKKGVKAAWIDEEDDKYSVKAALKAQHRKLPRSQPEKKYSEFLHNKFTNIVGTPNWAELKKEDHDSDDSDNEILKHSNHLVVQKVKKLPKETIEIKALAKINKKTHTEGRNIDSVQFHPTSTVAFVAGSSGVLSVFEVDGRENNKLHSIKFENFPISTARFLNKGMNIVAGSLGHAYFYTYDLMSGNITKSQLPHGITNMKKFEISPNEEFIAICGRLGEIHVLSSATSELISTFKMNKKCNALAFTPDSQKLITHGESSDMFVWDMRRNQCIHRAFDDGCLSAGSIAISPSGQFVATGSKQGAVNIYDTNTVLQSTSPTPLKVILNLVTSITNVRFNPTSEILAMASAKKSNAFKMVHLPSFTVFSNFPTFQTKLSNPLAIDFSPGSGYMSVSNNRGFAYLYRLKHYGNY